MFYYRGYCKKINLIPAVCKNTDKEQKIFRRFFILLFIFVLPNLESMVSTLVIGNTYGTYFYSDDRILRKTDEKIYLNFNIRPNKNLDFYSSSNFFISLNYNSAHYDSKFRKLYYNQQLRVRYKVNNNIQLYSSFNPYYGIKDYYFRSRYIQGVIVKLPDMRFNFQYSLYYKNISSGVFDHDFNIIYDWRTGKNVYLFHKVRVSAKIVNDNNFSGNKVSFDSLKCTYQLRFDVKKVFDAAVYYIDDDF